MFSPLTRILVRIFAKGFFRVNSGFLVFLFVTVISYCFFMNIVGDPKLMSPEEIMYYQFIVVMSFINSPVFTLMVGVIWFVYALKSWIYVIKQLWVPNNQFLFYSITSASKRKLFVSLFCMQSAIFAPLLIYWLFAVMFAIGFHHYLLPGLILLYLTALTVLSAVIYMTSINLSQSGNAQSYLLQIVQSWKKSYYALFIYQIMHSRKLNFLLLKMLSWFIITISAAAFSYDFKDLRVAGIIILLVITAHSFLIYQHHRFEEQQLSFSRNLPISRNKRFAGFVLLYLMFIVPEVVWLFSKFSVIISIKVLLFGISCALVYKCILYFTGVRMNKYLPAVLFLFVLFFYIVMFDELNLLTFLNLAGSFGIFYTMYYRYQEII